MEAGTVPVSWNRFGGEGDDDAEFFCDAVEQETGHPEMVTHWAKSAQSVGETMT